MDNGFCLINYIRPAFVRHGSMTLYEVFASSVSPWKILAPGAAAAMAGIVTSIGLL